jgi:hypothetical protein
MSFHPYCVTRQYNSVIDMDQTVLLFMLTVLFVLMFDVINLIAV